jgi:uncharacterized protein
MDRNLKRFYRSIVSFIEYDGVLIANLDMYSNKGILPKNDKAINIINISNVLKLFLDNNGLYQFYLYIENLNIKYPLSNEIFDYLSNMIKENKLYEIVKFINEKQYFGPNTKLFSIGIINNYIYRKYSNYVTIYDMDYKYLLNSLNNKNSFNKYINNLIEAEKKYFINKILTLDEIINKLDNFPKRLKEFLKIEQIRIFGSYARNEQTENSDYDFLIITNDKNYDNNLTRSLLENYFETLFGEHIDIIAIDINQKTINPFEIIILLQSKIIKKFGVI